MKKKNFLTSTTDICHYICEKYLEDNREASEIVGLDGTSGNGHDTVWLSMHCNRVYAFDIQEKAIEETERSLIKETDKNTLLVKEWRKKINPKPQGVFLVNDSHEYIDSYIGEKLDVAVFNLGYLPGGDKSLSTSRDSTLKAIDSALSILKVGGVLTITLYWGHEEGKNERESILAWAAGLDKSSYHCMRTDMMNQPNCPPEVIFITRKK